MDILEPFRQKKATNYTNKKQILNAEENGTRRQISWYWILSKWVKTTTLYISSCPSWLFKKSGGYFNLLERFHSRTEWTNHSNRCKLQSKRVEDHSKKSSPYNMAFQRVLFHSFLGSINKTKLVVFASGVSNKCYSRLIGGLLVVKT